MKGKQLSLAAVCLIALASCGEKLEKAPEAPKTQPRELYANPPMSSHDIDAVVAETRNKTAAKK